MNSENNVFETDLVVKIRGTFDNTFIKIADSDGLARIEKLFNIYADPEIESLEFRRQRLWNRLNTSPLYTERVLDQKLTEILGKNNYYCISDYNNYTLDIYATRPGKSWFNELKIWLARIMPCNIVWTIHIFLINWQAVYDNTNSWQDLVTKNLTWQEVLEGEWIEDE